MGILDINIGLGSTIHIASCYAPSHLPSSGWASDLACSLLRSPGLARFEPLPPRFIISAYSFISPFLVPFPHAFHVSNICLFSCSPSPIPLPNSDPWSLFHSTLHHIPLVLFCFHYCFQPYARFLWPWYVLFDTYTLRTSCMFPQSEIDIDCPSWAPLYLFRTFQTFQTSVCPNWGQGNIGWQSIKA